MAIQTNRLVCAVLGVENDVPPPPPSFQPKLSDGIHLRYQSQRQLGFPWYGYYILRRLSGPTTQPACFSGFPSPAPDATPSPAWQLRMGTFSSELNLVFTDDFAPTGKRELSLKNRRSLRFDMPPGQIARRISLKIGFLASDSSPAATFAALARPSVHVAGYSDSQLIVEKTAAGDPKSVVDVILEGDRLTSVVIDGANAALVDLCTETISQDIGLGWAVIAGPIGLPVNHPKYPLSNAAPEIEIQKRIKYGSPADWSSGGPPDAQQRLAGLNSLLTQLVQNGPPQSMAGVSGPITTVESGSGAQGPKMQQSPLDLLLVGAMNPATAQVLGLYYVDDSAQPNTAYDYMVVADHTNAGGAQPIKILALVASGNFQSIEAYVVFNKRRAQPPPLTPPSGLRAFVLPGNGPLPDGRSSEMAALRWDAPPNGSLLPDRPFLFHVWRASRGSGPSPSPTPLGPYEPLTYRAVPRVDHPVLISPVALPGGTQPERPKHWPPPAVPIHFVDRPGADGWYSYQVSSVSLFGQHSPPSADAPWYQWTPAPDPVPWYYKQGAGDALIQPNAVDLVDKTPPPPPTGIEASLLDPLDPNIIADGRYRAWRKAVPNVGLRAKWVWTAAHMRQAPDTKEFRLYWHPDSAPQIPDKNDPIAWQQRMYALGYNPVTPSDYLTAVNAAGLPLSNLAATASGSTLIMKGNPDLSGVAPDGVCAVINNDYGSPFRVLVVDPAQQTITLDAPPLPIDLPVQLFVTLAYPAVTTEYITALDASGNALEGLVCSVAGNIVTVGGNANLANIRGAGEWLVREGDAHAVYRITAVSPNSRKLTVSPAPPAAVLIRFRIAFPMRTYEVLLPRVQDANKADMPIAANPDRPEYAVVAISAADDKTGTADNPKWAGTSWGNRPGNEGRVSDAARVVRVSRTIPKPIQIEGDFDRMYATRADYYGDSFYTVRWKPNAGQKVHLYRALDDAVFQCDWKIRQTAPAARKITDQDPVFPTFITNKSAIAQELNAITSLLGYATLSDGALRVLAGLPGNDKVFQQITIQPLETATHGDVRGPEDADNYVVRSGYCAYKDTLPGRARNRYLYRSIVLDGVGNRSAMGLAGPPVYLPAVVPPAAPNVSKVLGGNRFVRIIWNSDTDANLVEYRIYRAYSERAAADCRSMVLVATVPPSHARDIEWPDTSVPAGQAAFYRVVAVDKFGNSSSPSAIVAGACYDETRPDPPAWNPPTTSGPGRLTLSWTAPAPDLVCLVERRSTNGDWKNLSSWLTPGQYSFEDTTRVAGAVYDYRLSVLTRDGKQNSVFVVISA